jgi:ABC-2 type transport system ATP-binding protein
MTIAASAHPPVTAGLALHAAGPGPEASVELEGLHVGYGTRSVLNGLDWRLQPGQVVGLLGRNGAGKSTLLETLLGLREAQQGSVHLFGQPVQGLSDRERARIGYVPQQSDLFEWLTPAQLLAYFRGFYPRWNEARMEGLLSRWPIERHQPIANLSVGQRQRLSIVRALCHEPDLLVLDEPVASLDPAARRDFLRELVGEVLERGTTVVFSTHILSDLERVAFNVAFLAGGRIVLNAPLDALVESCLSVTGPEAEVQAWCRARGAQVLAQTQLDGGKARWLVRVPDAAAAEPAPSGINAERLSLEELFMEVTR